MYKIKITEDSKIESSSLLLFHSPPSFLPSLLLPSFPLLPSLSLTSRNMQHYGKEQQDMIKVIYINIILLFDQLWIFCCVFVCFLIQVVRIRYVFSFFFFFFFFSFFFSLLSFSFLFSLCSLSLSLSLSFSVLPLQKKGPINLGSSYSSIFSLSTYTLSLFI